MKILIYVGYQKESVNKEYWLSKGMNPEISLLLKEEEEEEKQQEL